MKRFILLYVAPTLLVLGAVAMPLASGGKTLYLRDVLNAHYQLKVAQADALRAGDLPLVDPFRGYQPLLGNLNGAPLYPDNVLYLVAPPLWALNAHFWLHLLLAPFAMFWLARVWGLGREAAWAAGVCYAASGFFLSQLNLYNLVAGVALLPAFAAAVVRAWEGPRASDPGGRRSRRGTGGRTIALGLLWTLLLLAGDPLTALLALVLGLSAAAARHRRPPRSPLYPLLALVCGTLVALPQIVATTQILPASYRGFRGYSLETILAQSWDPRTVLEWLVPFVFGRPNLGFWGSDFYGGHEPLFLTFYPGLLALALVAVAGRPRSTAAWWAWGTILTGLFLALGVFNPPLRALLDVTGGAWLRYPVKVWPLVAVAAALLCGLGWARATGDDAGRRRLFLTVGALGLVQGFVLVVARHPPAFVERVWRDQLSGALLVQEPARWATLALLNLVLAALFLALLWVARRRPPAIAAILALHAASQLFLLQPAWDLDDAEPYRERPALLAAVPAGARVVHGRVDDLFGPLRSNPRPHFPDVSLRWAERLRFAELFPQAGVSWGRRYDFDRSPEGLDTFASVALAQAVKKMDDRDRLRVLEASGVDTLILDRSLDDDARERAVLTHREPSHGREIHVYRLPGAAPEAYLASSVWRVVDPRRALARLLDPGFDPRRAVVVPGAGPDRELPPGRLRLVTNEPGLIEADVASAAGAVLVVQRAHLPLYRATVDGRSVPVLPANVHRLAIEVPAGEHRVRLWLDRRPLAGSALVALVALVTLLSSPWWPRGRLASTTDFPDRSEF